VAAVTGDSERRPFGRRSYLAGLTGAVAMLAGCSGGGGDGDGTGTSNAKPSETGTVPTDEPPTSDGSPDEPTAEETATPEPEPAEKRPVARLTPDGDATAFGSGVAVSDDGETLVVGVPGIADGGGVAVFESSGDGWKRATVLQSPESSYNDAVGSSVAVSADGTTVVVGAPGAGHAGAGAVEFFARGADGWRQQGRLFVSDGDRDDLLGTAVAVSGDGDLAVAGAPADERDEDEDSAFTAGSTYTFEREDGSWSEVDARTPADTGVVNWGSAVAMSAAGDRLLVGASVRGSGGSVHVLDRDSGGWDRTATLTAAHDDENGDRFGRSVALAADGTVAVVGAPWVDIDADDEVDRGGAAYVFDESSDWSQPATLQPRDVADEGEVGESVAVTDGGDRVVVGASGVRVDGQGSAGEAYAFERADGEYRHRATFRPDSAQSASYFGSTIDTTGDGGTLVGSPSRDLDGQRNAGAVFRFD